MYKLEVENLYRNFGRRRVLQDISFSLQSGDSLAVIGKNGSGKTTLLKILAGLSAPTRGKVIFTDEDRRLNRNEARRLLSYVGPELTLYDSLTAAENLDFFATMRGVTIDRGFADQMLDTVGLGGRGDDYYRAYSSGMKQRLKYAVALLNDPIYLLLDEPTSNLDDEGRRIVSQIIARQRENGILIMAANETEEYGFAQRQYRLNG